MLKPLPPPWDRFVPFAQKIFVWALFFVVLWFLRPFFFLVFLTFVFGYVLEHVVQNFERLISSRRARVVIGFLGLLAILVGLGLTIGPAMYRQATAFPGEAKKHLGSLDELIASMRNQSEFFAENIPEDLKAGDVFNEILGLEPIGTENSASQKMELPPGQDYVISMAGRKFTDEEIGLLKEQSVYFREHFPEDLSEQDVRSEIIALERVGTGEERGDNALLPPDQPYVIHINGRRLLDEEIGILRQESKFFREAYPDELTAKDVQSEVIGLERVVVYAPTNEDEAEQRWRPILPFVISVAGRSLSIASFFLLALLFSFLILLDLPNLAKGARHLHDTRLRFIYDEISESIFRFGRVLGRALEAQLMIAIVNTSLTAIGLAYMGLPNLAFLSTVVFVCSFIPVAGVFISSVPICLAALTASGIGLVGVAIIFITIIHIIEAYILNPRIYGAHLRMNPVIVLAILVISHHVFGVWGLILGVPVANYVYHYVIHGRDDGRKAVVAAKNDNAPRKSGKGKKSK